MTVEKQEDVLKSLLMLDIRTYLPTYVGFRHEDVLTCGIPDISVDGNKRTSWLEVKHATPIFSGTGLQELMLQRLAVASFAWYVIYAEDGPVKKTLIVHPHELKTARGSPKRRYAFELTPVCATDGFDHAFVVEYLKQIHSHENTR